jgi:NAD+ synthase
MHDAVGLTDAIAMWLRDQLDASGAERFVLGLSGGLDSATVCALCCQAVGAQRVLAAIMPSHSNPTDADHARLVATQYGVMMEEIDLSSATDAFLAAMPDVDAARATGEVAERLPLAIANIRPRLRMATLYYLASIHRGLVVGTGNKSEALVGYFTKYGDGGVDLFPIVDLFKDEVRAVARVLEVPDVILMKAPSAGLWPGQTDEDELGLTYDQLEVALRGIEAHPEREPTDPLQARVWRMYHASAHKRWPIPAFRQHELA